MLESLSIIGYLAMLGGLVALLAMRSLFSLSLVVILVQAAALLLFFWARVTFGRRSFHVRADPTEGGLVTAGPYRYIRHPIYSAMCLMIWAGATAHWSWRAAICGLMVLGGAVVRILCEEKLVAARYPEYGRYAATT